MVTSWDSLRFALIKLKMYRDVGMAVPKTTETKTLNKNV